jgi:micrococcal nuclease
VDGDTLVVEIAGRTERVRLIGVDTPETVHPQKPVEHFGKEASAFTKQLAEGQRVRLEPDPQNADRDKYNRLLRYVYLPDGRLLNAEIIAQGYGHAYTRFPFAKMEEFRALEREAREAGRGLWSDSTDGKKQPTN